MSLKGKNILITAGPTWVPLDNIRVISNIASGQTGIFLAKKLTRMGAKVTLLLGPAGFSAQNRKIKLVSFIFFNDLKNMLKKELAAKKYDCIIHSAAVADFQPVSSKKGKLSSEKAFNLKLVPLPKIIKDIRRLAPKAKLVMFKLESGVSDTILLSRAKTARQEVNADYVVANQLDPYRAFIIAKTGCVTAVKSKIELANNLIKILNRDFTAKKEL